MKRDFFIAFIEKVFIFGFEKNDLLVEEIMDLLGQFARREALVIRRHQRVIKGDFQRISSIVGLAMEGTEGPIFRHRQNRNRGRHRGFEAAGMEIRHRGGLGLTVPGSLGENHIRAIAIMEPLFDRLNHFERLAEIRPVHEQAIDRLDRGADEWHLPGFFFRDERNRLLAKINDRQRIEVAQMVGDQKKLGIALFKGAEFLDILHFPIEPKMVEDIDDQAPNPPIAFLQRRLLRMAGVAPNIEGVIPQKTPPSPQNNPRIFEHALNFNILSQKEKKILAKRASF